MRLITSELPGTGGLFKATPEDFVVDEMALYPPSGAGAHTFVRIEKRGLTTAEAVTRLCRVLSVSSRDVGVAGQKDRQALTRQWISLPGVEPERALAAAADGVRVLEAARHGHKLRTGHLAGNRFVLTVRGVVAEALPRAQAILSRLSRTGLPSYYGPQRFGARGDNAARGKKLLSSELRVAGSERRLLVSAYQAELFNRYLDARVDDGLLCAALLGDVMKKTDTGGLFTVEDVADAQARLEAGALVVTGPMFGHKMMAPEEGTASRRREQAILDAEGIDAHAWKRLGKLAEGTRRPLVFPLAEANVRRVDDALVFETALPPGAYATVLLAELMKA